VSVAAGQRAAGPPGWRPRWRPLAPSSGGPGRALAERDARRRPLPAKGRNPTARAGLPLMERRGWDSNPRTRLHPVSGFQDDESGASIWVVCGLCGYRGREWVIIGRLGFWSFGRRLRARDRGRLLPVRGWGRIRQLGSWGGCDGREELRDVRFATGLAIRGDARIRGVKPTWWLCSTASFRPPELRGLRRPLRPTATLAVPLDLPARSIELAHSTVAIGTSSAASGRPSSWDSLRWN
jgi:hypothetical protein